MVMNVLWCLALTTNNYLFHIHAGSRYTPNTARKMSAISPTVHSSFTASMIGGIRFTPLPAAACTFRQRPSPPPWVARLLALTHALHLLRSTSG